MVLTIPLVIRIAKKKLYTDCGHRYNPPDVLHHGEIVGRKGDGSFFEPGEDQASLSEEYIPREIRMRENGCTEELRVENCTWSNHLEDIENLLKNLNDEDLASKFCLFAYIQRIIRGQTNKIRAISESIAIEDIRLPADESSAGPETAKIYIPGKHDPRAQFNRHVKGRRFIIMVYYFDKIHLASGIFDRTARSLLYLDSLSVGYEKRLAGAGLATKMYMDNIGFPFTFWVYGKRYADQGDGWSCGYFTLLLLHQHLRVLPGARFTRSETLEEAAEGYVKRAPLVKRSRWSIAIAKGFGLKLSGWVGAGRSREYSHAKMRDFLRAQCLDELATPRNQWAEHKYTGLDK